MEKKRPKKKKTKLTSKEPLAQMFGRKYFDYVNGSVSPVSDNLPAEGGERCCSKCKHKIR
jgi:hypothetical protein